MSTDPPPDDGTAPAAESAQGGGPAAESPPRRRPLTLRDVSEASGVSEMTVSRVLRDRGDVSPATRERVLEAARRLGYVPNRIAGALASARVNLVAVIIPSLSNMVFPEVMAGISEGLEGTGLQPVVGISGYDAAREAAVLYEMLSWRPAGVILAGLEHGPEARAMLGRAGVPVVEIMDTDGDAIDSVVGLSHRTAGQAIGQRVLAAGYWRIAYLGSGLPGDHRARKRREGFEAALAGAGLALEQCVHYPGGASLALGRDMTQALMERAPDLDFLFFANDLIGAGGLMWALGAGYDVPDRLGMVGFNGIDLLDGLPVRLASMDARRREIGRTAAAIVAAGESGRRVAFVARLQPGETIRPPRA